MKKEREVYYTSISEELLLDNLVEAQRVLNESEIPKGKRHVYDCEKNIVVEIVV